MNHLVAAPILLPLVAGIVLLLLGRRDLRLVRALSLAAVLGQVGLALLLGATVKGGRILAYALGNWPAPFGIVLAADRLAAWMLLTTALLALCALLYASRGSDADGRHFHPLFQWQLFGLNGAFLTGDLFNLFVFFEVLLLASYGLLLHGGGGARTRAGLHYVVANLAGSALFLVAVGTLYGLYGTLNLADLAVKVAAAPTGNLGLTRVAGLLLFAVFALKAALLPLHLWLPAAYASAGAPVAALFAIMTKLGAYCILRVFSLVFGAGAGDLAHLVDPWLLPLALATLAAGMLGALAATRLREQAAYLLLASAGTLLAAFGLGSGAGIAAGLYYLPQSTFAGAALFLLADLIAAGRGATADLFEPAPPPPHAPLLGGLFFLVAVLAVGLPPLSGFLGKFLILRAAMAHPALPWVMAVMLAGGLAGLVALARAGSLLFYHALPSAAGGSAAGPIAGAALPVIVLLVLCLALTVLAGPVQEHAAATAEQLLQPEGYIQAILGRKP